MCIFMYVVFHSSRRGGLRFIASCYRARFSMAFQSSPTLYQYFVCNAQCTWPKNMGVRGAAGADPRRAVKAIGRLPAGTSVCHRRVLHLVVDLLILFASGLWGLAKRLHKVHACAKRTCALDCWLSLVGLRWCSPQWDVLRNRAMSATLSHDPVVRRRVEVGRGRSVRTPLFAHLFAQAQSNPCFFSSGGGGGT